MGSLAQNQAAPHQQLGAQRFTQAMKFETDAEIVKTQHCIKGIENDQGFPFSLLKVN